MLYFDTKSQALGSRPYRKKCAQCDNVQQTLHIYRTYCRCLFFFVFPCLRYVTLECNECGHLTEQKELLSKKNINTVEDQKEVDRIKELRKSSKAPLHMHLRSAVTVLTVIVTLSVAFYFDHMNRKEVTSYVENPAGGVLLIVNSLSMDDDEPSHAIVSVEDVDASRDLIRCRTYAWWYGATEGATTHAKKVAKTMDEEKIKERFSELDEVPWSEFLKEVKVESVIRLS